MLAYDEDDVAPPDAAARAGERAPQGTVVRLRSKMGSLRGVARVDGKVVCEGQMTFALGDAPGA